MQTIGSMTEQTEPKKYHVTTWISGGMLIVGVCTFLGSKMKTPLMVWLMGFYLVSFLFSISFGWWKKLFKTISVGRSWHHVRCKYGHDIKLTLGSLRDALSDKSDTFRRLFMDVAGWTELSPQNRFHTEHLDTIQSWLIRLSERLVWVKGQNAFSDWVSELDWIIYQCNRYWVEKHRCFETAMREKPWPDNRLQQFKREWNQRREKWVRFVAEWETLRSRINEEVGKRTCSSYFEMISMF
jgi:hypothetical protein